MSTIILALAAAAGMYLLIPRSRNSGPRSALVRRFHPSALLTDLQRWLTSTGLGSVSPQQFVAVSVVVALIAAGTWWILIGAGVPMLVVAGVAGAVPTTVWRRRHANAATSTMEAWPRMIEEIRVRVGSVGQPIPQALIETGLSAPDPIRASFVSAQRHWTLTTDFESTVAMLKDSLADPTADAVCETLLVIQQVGGDPDTRLETLAVDRRADLRERREADARSAGARLARWFVVIVPAGMAFAGLNLGDGQVAYSSAGGQIATIIAIAMVIACWWWAGHIMATPPQRRVFDQ